jgi:hypothetical protein
MQQYESRLLCYQNSL